MGAMRRMAVYLGLAEEQPRLPRVPDDVSGREVRVREGRRGRSGRRRGEAEAEPVEIVEEEYPPRSVRTVSTGTTPRSVRAFQSDEGLAGGDRDGYSSRGYVGMGSTGSMDLTGEFRRPEVHRIETVHPLGYSDARIIGEHFRAGVPVIMDLSQMDERDAKRLVDFSAGLVFALHGGIERISSRVFLLSPAGVDVTDVARSRVSQGGSGY